MSNPDFKPTVEYEIRCLIVDDLEPIIMSASPEAQKILLPSFREFSCKVKDESVDTTKQ